MHRRVFSRCPLEASSVYLPVHRKQSHLQALRPHPCSRAKSCPESGPHARPAASRTCTQAVRSFPPAHKLSDSPAPAETPRTEQGSICSLCIRPPAPGEPGGRAANPPTRLHHRPPERLPRASSSSSAGSKEVRGGTPPGRGSPRLVWRAVGRRSLAGEPRVGGQNAAGRGGCVGWDPGAVPAVRTSPTSLPSAFSNVFVPAAITTGWEAVLRAVPPRTSQVT